MLANNKRKRRSSSGGAPSTPKETKRRRNTDLPASGNNQVPKDSQAQENQEKLIWETPNVLVLPTVQPNTPKCINKSTHFPQKYNLLLLALDALHLFVQFRRATKNSWCWFKDAKTFVEQNLGREFTLDYLAQLKTLLGEGMVWELGKQDGNNNQVRFRFNLNQYIKDKKVFPRQLQVSELYMAQRNEVKTKLFQIRQQVLKGIQSNRKKLVQQEMTGHNSSDFKTELDIKPDLEYDLQENGFKILENQNSVNEILSNEDQNQPSDNNLVKIQDIEKCPLPEQRQKRQSLTSSIKSKSQNQANENAQDVCNAKNIISHDILQTPSTLDRRMSLESSSVHGQRLSFTDSLAAKFTITPSDRKKIDENVQKFARRISFGGELDEETMKTIEDKEIQSFINSKSDTKQTIPENLRDRLLGQVFDAVRSIFGVRGSRVRKFEDLVKQLHGNMGANYEEQEIRQQVELLVERLPECFVKKVDENGQVLVQIDRRFDATAARKKLTDKRAKTQDNMLSPIFE